MADQLVTRAQQTGARVTLIVDARLRAKPVLSKKVGPNR